MVIRLGLSCKTRAVVWPEKNFTERNGFDPQAGLVVFSNFQVFAGNEDFDTVVAHALSPKIRHNRYVRFVVIAWHGRINMRVEVYGCKE